jgi:hypothetical protein
MVASTTPEDATKNVILAMSFTHVDFAMTMFISMEKWTQRKTINSIGKILLKSGVMYAN